MFFKKKNFVLFLSKEIEKINLDNEKKKKKVLNQIK